MLHPIWSSGIPTYHLKRHLGPWANFGLPSATLARAVSWKKFSPPSQKLQNYLSPSLQWKCKKLANPIFQYFPPFAPICQTVMPIRPSSSAPYNVQCLWYWWTYFRIKILMCTMYTVHSVHTEMRIYLDILLSSVYVQVFNEDCVH